MLEPEVETRPWPQQFALDDEAYRAQIAYLLQNSPFYQAKLGEAGFETPQKTNGLAAISALPFTEKSEIRASCTNENPIGAHLAVARDEIARIYSTSGTTGTPSYIPLTGARSRQLGYDFGAQLFGFRRRGRATRSCRPTMPGPSSRARPLPPSINSACRHIPVGTGNTERLMTAIRMLKPEAAVLTPSYASYLIEWAAERKFDLKGSSVKRVLVAGEPGGGEPACAPGWRMAGAPG